MNNLPAFNAYPGFDSHPGHHSLLVSFQSVPPLSVLSCLSHRLSTTLNATSRRLACDYYANSTSRLRKSHFNLTRPTCSTRYGRIAATIVLTQFALICWRWLETIDTAITHYRTPPHGRRVARNEIAWGLRGL